MFVLLMKQVLLKSAGKENEKAAFPGTERHHSQDCVCGALSGDFVRVFADGNKKGAACAALLPHMPVVYVSEAASIRCVMTMARPLYLVFGGLQIHRLSVGKRLLVVCGA